MKSQAKSIIAKTKPRGRRGRFRSYKPPSLKQISEEMIVHLGIPFGVFLFIVILLVH